MRQSEKSLKMFNANTRKADNENRRILFPPFAGKHRIIIANRIIKSNPEQGVATYNVGIPSTPIRVLFKETSNENIERMKAEDLAKSKQIALFNTLS
jgi:H2-forming N5,N10-methylenetetrahydromethanopterin dehydrogenase-like enzyme